MRAVFQIVAQPELLDIRFNIIISSALTPVTSGTQTGNRTLRMHFKGIFVFVLATLVISQLFVFLMMNSILD